MAQTATGQGGAGGGGRKMAQPTANAAQERFWDVDAGPTWVHNMRAMDVCLAPVLSLVLDKAALRAGEKVLDIGCGAGTSSFAAADAVGPTGSVLGADISKTLLAEARSRAGANNTQFVYADAQTYGFAPASFDVMISRFGVMFFDDPVTAFRNMAAALRPHGRTIFATWGAIPANPYFMLPARVAKAYLGPTPKSDPDAPGPFAFRDPHKVCKILADAGFAHPLCDVVTTTLTPSGGAAGFAELAMQIGPAPGALSYFDATQAQHDTLKAKIADAAQVFVKAGDMQLPAEINVFSAQAS